MDGRIRSIQAVPSQQAGITDRDSRQRFQPGSAAPVSALANEGFDDSNLFLHNAGPTRP